MFSDGSTSYQRIFADSSHAYEKDLISLKYLFENLDEVRARIVESKRTYLLLDCDGTVTPIVSEPRQVVMSKRMVKVLRALSKMPSCILAIVSGRSLRDVRRLVDIDEIYYMGNHGIEIAGPRVHHTDRTAQDSRQTIEQVYRELRHLESIGAAVEDKQLTLTVHFRKASPRVVPVIKSAVSVALHACPQLEVTAGKKVLEIRPRTAWNKGLAVQWLISQIGRGLSIYVGDDRTDEDAFSRLNGGITILISKRRRPTNANYYLKDVTEVYTFLSLLLSWIQPKIRNRSHRSSQ